MDANTQEARIDKQLEYYGNVGLKKKQKHTIQAIATL